MIVFLRWNVSAVLMSNPVLRRRSAWYTLITIWRNPHHITLHHVTQLLIFGTPFISQKLLKLELSKLMHRLAISSLAEGMTLHPQNGRGYGHVTYLKCLVLPIICLERLMLENSVCELVGDVTKEHKDYKFSLKWAWSWLRYVFRF